MCPYLGTDANGQRMPSSHPGVAGMMPGGSNEVSMWSLISVAVVVGIVSAVIVSRSCSSSRKRKAASATAAAKDAPKPDPVYLTADELRRYDGTDDDLPIYLAVSGTIYDVSAGREFYKKGSGYNLFAGRDATRLLAKGSLDVNDAEGDAPLSVSEKDSLRSWEERFAQKYVIAGKLVKDAAEREMHLAHDAAKNPEKKAAGATAGKCPHLQ